LLVFETIEARRLLACITEFDGQKLDVKCDRDADTVNVSSDSDGNLIVNGDNLGSAAELEKVEIKTDRGDDTVVIDGLTVQGDVKISTDRGEDTVQIVGLIAEKKLEIKTDRGSDIVSVENSEIHKDLKIKTDRGEDIVSVLATDVHETLEIKTDRGDDDVTLAGIQAGKDIKVDTDRGSDVVEATDLTADDKIKLDGGKGRDELRTTSAVLDVADVKSFENIVIISEASEITGSGAVLFTDGGGVSGAAVTASFEGQTSTTGTTGAGGQYSITTDGAAPGLFRVDVSADVDGIPLSSTRYGFVPEGSDTVVLDPIELPNPATTQLFNLGGGEFSDFDEVQILNMPLEVTAVYAEAYDQQTEPDAFPGLVGDGTDAFNSTVFAWLLALDADGNEVENFAAPVTVRLRIPENQFGDIFDLTPGNGQIDVPMYSFDEVSGQWVVEDTGIITDFSGVAYPEAAAEDIRDGLISSFNVRAQFQTDHFSYWNLDYKKTDFPGSGQPGFFDFGDVGDASYPTTLADNGVRHADPNRLWLGQWADLESDANVVNQDVFDDGLLSIDPISVRVNNWDVSGDIFLNVLIDRNNDGDWLDPGEWAVQNAVTGTPLFKGASFDTTESWDPDSEGALRLTVTNVSIANYDGTGEFALGETEDYLGPPRGDLIVDVIGGGAVTSDVVGIDCPDGDCTGSFVGGSAVTLTATPDPNREFLGWNFGQQFRSDDCTDRGNNPTCTVIVDANQSTSVAAVFTENIVRAFSLAPGSPTLAANGWSPADILLMDEDSGVVTRLLSTADLGLVEADDIDALSFVTPGQSSAVSTEFSVSEDSAGAPGTQIETEAAFPGDLGADVWALGGLGGGEGPEGIGAIDPSAPFQWVDEDGINAGTNHPIAAAGLVPGDEIDAWSRVDPADPGTPYYSLAPGSPTLTPLLASPADILETDALGDASIAVSHTDLGLDSNDDVDALSGNIGTGGFEVIYVSLAADSPSLADNGWNATYVLTSFNFGNGFGTVFPNLTEFELGLLDTDELDALDLFFGNFGEPS
jgi:hypothetical protein